MDDVVGSNAVSKLINTAAVIVKRFTFGSYDTDWRMQIVKFVISYIISPYVSARKASQDRNKDEQAVASASICSSQHHTCKLYGSS